MHQIIHVYYLERSEILTTRTEDAAHPASRH